MTTGYWRDLAVTSVTDPAAAARTLMGLNLPRAILWTAVALVATLNAILFTVSNILVPAPVPIEGLPTSPFVYLVLIAAGLILTVYALFWIGRGLGGQGTLDDIMVLVVWLQGLRVIVQAVALALMLILPALAALLVFVAGLVGIYILLNFVKQAHRLNSLGQAAAILIAAVLAMALALVLAISILGGAITGS